MPGVHGAKPLVPVRRCASSCQTFDLADDLLEYLGGPGHGQPRRTRSEDRWPRRLTATNSSRSGRSSHAVYSRNRAAMGMRATSDPDPDCVGAPSHIIMVASTAAADTGACRSWWTRAGLSRTAAAICRTVRSTRCAAAMWATRSFSADSKTVGSDAQGVAYLLFTLALLAPVLGGVTSRGMPDSAVLVYKTGRLSVGSCAVATHGPD